MFWSSNSSTHLYLLHHSRKYKRKTPTKRKKITSHFLSSSPFLFYLFMLSNGMLGSPLLLHHVCIHMTKYLYFDLFWLTKDLKIT